VSAAVVIGGGISGLAVAALLADDGHDVTLVEARDQLGGRAGRWEQEGFRFDTGPSWYLMPEVFEHFFRMLGTTAERELDLVPLDPGYRVYGPPGSTTVDVRSGRARVRALFDELEPGAGARLDAYLDSAGEAYELSVERFLYDSYESRRGLADPALVRRLPTLAPLLARSLASHVERRFAHPRLRQILEYPAVFLGGSPYEVPALYHLMSHLDLDEGVLYPKGGFVEVIAAVERLARARGVDIRTSSPVTRIRTADAGTRRRGVSARATGVVLAGGGELDADLVVSTADLHHTETRLLPRGEQTYPERWWDAREPGPGALLLLLGVRGDLPQLAHHTLLFADGEAWRGGFDDIFGKQPHIPHPASLYVCRPSATDPDVAPAGHENLFVLVPVPADPSLGHGGVSGDGDAAVEAEADRVIAQISAWAGIPDLAERIVVRRTIAPGDFAADLNSWRGTALGLSHTLRQSAVFRPRNASARVAGLCYAGGSALPGIGLPMCLISAELVLKRVRGILTSGPLPEPVAAVES
jgi:1-hydroxy-2-isopentenylcarotenoid 3,4-desaturase